MGVNIEKDSSNYTYYDYLSWPENERWELIEGMPVAMVPAPSKIHQEVLGEIYRQIANFLEEKGRPCRVYNAPFDVRLCNQENARDEDIKTVVQPDILVVCDSNKLDDKGCKGAPDLIIEIVSPSTASLDYIKKLKLYEKYKVKEYWIVEPNNKIVHVHKLNIKDIYERPDIYSNVDMVPVAILEGLIIELHKVFS